ncbi:hypothetical protein pb186bvf_019400 [Paramecium bursaria]
MQPTQDIVETSGLNDRFVIQFPFYLEITQGKDGQLRAELSGDVFATNKNQVQTQAEQLFYNEKKASYSVALLFYLLHNHNLIELTHTKILLDKQNKDQFQTYGFFQFFKSAFTIDIKSLEDHINSLIGDNNIPPIQIKDQQFGAFYTFVRQCKLDDILWPLKSKFDEFIPHIHFGSAQQFNEYGGQFNAAFYTFQSSAEQPCYPLLKYNPSQLQQQFQQNIQKYNLDILQLALIDNNFQSESTKALMIQRSKPTLVQFVELFKNHPFLEFPDLRQQLQTNKTLANYHKNVIEKVVQEQQNYSIKFKMPQEEAIQFNQASIFQTTIEDNPQPQKRYY